MGSFSAFLATLSPIILFLSDEALTLQGFPNCDEMFSGVDDPKAFCATGRVTRDCARWCDPSYNRIFSPQSPRTHIPARPGAAQVQIQPNVEQSENKPNYFESKPEPYKKNPNTLPKMKPVNQVKPSYIKPQQMPKKANKTCDGMRPCVPLATANTQFKACCLRRGISASCAKLCTYDVKTHEMTATMMNNQECSIGMLEHYLKCAAAEKNNAVACCRAKNLLSGSRSKCEPFCNPFMLPTWPTTAQGAMKYFTCLSVQEQITQCHWAQLTP